MPVAVGGGGLCRPEKKDGDVANADAERIKQLQDEMARLNSDNAAAQDRINALLKENTISRRSSRRAARRPKRARARLEERPGA